MERPVATLVRDIAMAENHELPLLEHGSIIVTWRPRGRIHQPQGRPHSNSLKPRWAATFIHQPQGRPHSAVIHNRQLSACGVLICGGVGKGGLDALRFQSLGP